MYETLKNLAVLGDILFLLWIWYNGLDEGFRATPVQWAAYLGLTALLILNCVLIFRQKD